jgi:hypothetical protein
MQSMLDENQRQLVDAMTDIARLRQQLAVLPRAGTAPSTSLRAMSLAEKRT